MGWLVKNPEQWNTLLRLQAEPRTGLHVTDCLGCPRKRALLAEGVPVDLSKLESRLSGSILHGKLATVNPETAEVPVTGTLFSHRIVGSIDRIEDGLTVDYKTSEGGAPLPKAPYEEQVWQQEAYRYLLARFLTTGWRIYYRRGGKWSVYEHIGPVWTEEQLGELRPHGGAFTTREIAGQCVSGASAGSLPLVGATQKIGKGTACDWCEVAEACNDAGNEVEL